MNFFIDMIDLLVSNDYSIPDSIPVVKKAAKYYVSPTFFDDLLKIAKPEIDAFNDIHMRLKEARLDIQKNLEAHEVIEE